MLNASFFVLPHRLAHLSTNSGEYATKIWLASTHEFHPFFQYLNDVQIGNMSRYVYDTIQGEYRGYLASKCLLVPYLVFGRFESWDRVRLSLEEDSGECRGDLASKYFSTFNLFFSDIRMIRRKVL